MSEPQNIPLRPSVAKVIAAGGFFVLCAAGFAYMAWIGHTDVRLADFGAGPTIHVAWDGGNAYLPKGWFPEDEAYDQALSALKRVRESVPSPKC